MRSGQHRRAPVVAVVEGVVTATAGGAFAAFTGSLVGLTWPAAMVGAVNGAVSGGRGVYAWRRATGWVAFGLDSTWGLVMTASAVACHGVAFAQGGGGYVGDLSRRCNRHVYVRGMRLRRGFAITLGNVVNQAGEAAHTSPRRRRLVTDHEDVHVWQARWFGPAYPVLYVAWSILGGVVGGLVWVLRRRDEPVGRVVETCSYYVNPFEWWAYSRDGFWPPTRMVAGIGWRRPAVRAFAMTSRAGRRDGAT